VCLSGLQPHRRARRYSHRNRLSQTSETIGYRETHIHTVTDMMRDKQTHICVDREPCGGSYPVQPGTRKHTGSETDRGTKGPTVIQTDTNTEHLTQIGDTHIHTPTWTYSSSETHSEIDRHTVTEAKHIDMRKPRLRGIH
jgi:hypothetical protein